MSRTETPTIGLVTLGCAKNRVDSEIILGRARQAGFDIVNDPALADAIVVNTCGFIKSAKEESIETLLEMAKYKQNRCKALIASGCLAQRYADDLAQDMPELDAIVGVTEYDKITDIILRLLNNNNDDNHNAAEPLKFVNPASTCRTVLDGERVLTTNSATAYVRIADGCDHRCAYCAIPGIRGPFRSRPIESVLSEARSLAQRGVKEIVYIAQDTGRFGEDTERVSLLPRLLRETAAIDELAMVRVMYVYPSKVTSELLDTVASTPKVCKYLDIPLQHVDGAVLRRMNRWGDEKRISRLLERVRDAAITIRTTFLVGFPGETDEEFERLRAFTKEFQLDRMGAFVYSREEDTAAFGMDNQVDEIVAAQRLDILMKEQQRASLHRNKLRVGETCDMLVEGISGKDGKSVALVGRSEREAPECDGVINIIQDGGIYINKLTNYVNAVIPVRITKAGVYDLEGIIND